MKPWMPFFVRLSCSSFGFVLYDILTFMNRGKKWQKCKLQFSWIPFLLLRQDQIFRYSEALYQRVYVSGTDRTFLIDMTPECRLWKSRSTMALWLQEAPPQRPREDLPCPPQGPKVHWFVVRRPTSGSPYHWMSRIIVSVATGWPSSGVRPKTASANIL